MKPEGREVLTSVKGSFLRQPLVVLLCGALLAGLLAMNVAAFIPGMQAPWLLAAALIADMTAIGGGIFIAAREVLRADDRKEASEAQLASIVEWSDDAIVSMSTEGSIRSWNRGAERIFGYSAAEALGRPITIIIPEERHAEEVAVLGRIQRGETVSHFETMRRAKDGRLIEISLTVSPVRDAAGRIVGASKVARDITSRRRTESALSDTQARLGAIVDSAMDAMVTVDENQKIVLFNRAAEQVFGVRREDALGASLDRFLPARFRGAHRAHVEHFGRTGVTSRRMGDVTTLWGLRANGTNEGEEFPIEASISQVIEDGRRLFTAILRDVTLRRQAEEALKRSEQELRELSARVLEAREEEKTRIARELHDELGQLLTALKMDLSWLRERLPAELHDKAAEMSAMLDQTVTSTRRISADLRPLMLDDLGLADAAGWLVQDFAKRSRIQCDLRLPDPEALQDASKNVATAVYRAVQESLTNIGRHSGATNAWVILAVEDGMILVDVEDDGRGISPPDLAKARSLGLKGMRERFAYLGGSLEITPAPRGGTRLRLRVPLKARSAAA
jgi:PAS domain S-box-containing protein